MKELLKTVALTGLISSMIVLLLLIWLPVDRDGLGGIMLLVLILNFVIQPLSALLARALMRL